MIRRVFSCLLLLLAAGTVHARVEKPVIVIDQPGKCVETTEVMRRDHMKLLMHQRDRTLRAGVRTKAHSLAGCVECHASTKTGSVLGAQGFCQTCHDYAGVKPDCFECHASKAARAKP